MKITVGNNIEGYKIVEHKDVIFVLASSVEGGGYKQSAVKKAAHAAELIGANALINLNVIIHTIKENLYEATAYGDAVVVEEINKKPEETQPAKVNLEAYIPKPQTNTITAEIKEINGYKFVACPKCGTKYKTDVDQNGEIIIKGFNDVDNDEPGLQIFCLRCGTKFTVKDSK